MERTQLTRIYTHHPDFWESLWVINKSGKKKKLLNQNQRMCDNKLFKYLVSRGPDGFEGHMLELFRLRQKFSGNKYISNHPDICVNTIKAGREILVNCLATATRTYAQVTKGILGYQFSSNPSST